MSKIISVNTSPMLEPLKQKHVSGVERARRPNPKISTNNKGLKVSSKTTEEINSSKVVGSDH